MPERIGTVFEPKTFEQLGILVLDGSESMRAPGVTSMSKADEVNVAVRDLIARFKASRYKENFLLAVVTYDENATQRVKPTPVTELDDTADYNPLNGHGGETAIGRALQSAQDVANAFLDGQESAPRTAVIVVMSDGQNTTGPNPIEVVAKIKSQSERVTICAAGYGKGKDLDEQTLKSIVTSPNGYKHTYNAEDLRAFFFASVTQQRG